MIDPFEELFGEDIKRLIRRIEEEIKSLEKSVSEMIRDFIDRYLENPDPDMVVQMMVFSNDKEFVEQQMEYLLRALRKKKLKEAETRVT